MIAEVMVSYFVIGVVVAMVCEKSIKEQADRAHAEMCAESGNEVPYGLVAAMYLVLAVVGWPFFLSVSIERKK